MSATRLQDYVDQIRSAATEALDFVEGLSKEDFLLDRRTQQAVMMNLMIVGEATARLMERFPDFAAAHPNIPWRAMRGMRNRIAHGYFEVDFEIVWQTVTTSLPTLLLSLPTIPNPQ